MIANRHFALFAAIAALTYLTAACSGEKPEQSAFDADKVQIVKAPINPNGDSELALLMRVSRDNGVSWTAPQATAAA